ncbi:MAG: Metallopeptidase [Candidatus Woesebacteria bacterium GW2011_GWD2_40_19]|nr:MAG: Metallopeptidase [Candidatus Woesebacteria bacterium GW2011_GWD2_40_19]
MDILILIIGIAGFALAIILHEVAHGLVAERLGDPTARLMGRLTLNPISHIDIVGSIILPLTLLILRSPFLFGWAKPVPVDPYNLQHPKKDLALISLAGPLANISFALVLSIFLRIILTVFPNTNIFAMFFYVIEFNIDLIPVGPLDGAKILTGLLPNKQAKAFGDFLDKFGMILILALIFPIFGGSSLVTLVISPVINVFLKLLIPGFSSI